MAEQGSHCPRKGRLWGQTDTKLGTRCTKNSSWGGCGFSTLHGGVKGVGEAAQMQVEEGSCGWRGCAGGKKLTAAGEDAVGDGGVIYLGFWKLDYLRGGLSLRCDGEGRVTAQGIHNSEELGRTVLPGVRSRVLPRQAQTQPAFRAGLACLGLGRPPRAASLIPGVTAVTWAPRQCSPLSRCPRVSSIIACSSSCNTPGVWGSSRSTTH